MCVVADVFQTYPVDSGGEFSLQAAIDEAGNVDEDF